MGGGGGGGRGEGERDQKGWGWSGEGGREEGSKYRPGAVIIGSKSEVDWNRLVTVSGKGSSQSERL